MNKFTKSVIVLYIFAGLILLFGPKSLFPGFYKPNFMAALALVSVILICLPSVIFRTNDAIKKRAREMLQFNIAINLLINGAGGLGLYRLYLIGFEYDKLTHYVTPFLLVIGFYYFLRKWQDLTHKKALLFVTVGVLVAGFGWEVLEYLSDVLFDTQLLGGGSAQVAKDTIFDVIANILGITTATAYLHTKNRKK